MGILGNYSKSKIDSILLFSISLTWTSRALTFIAFPNPVSAPDSPTYYSGDFLNFDLVSFTGHAARGWFVPAIYSLMPTSSALEFMQLCISGTAWTYLLVVVAQTKILSKRYTRILLIILAVLAASAQVIQHDTTILSTSLTNSVFILIIALLIRIRFVPKQQSFTLFSILICGTVLSIQKTTFFPFAMVLTILGLMAAWKFLSLPIKTSLLVSVLIVGVFVTSVGSNVNNSWQVSYSGQTLLWQLGGQSPSAREFGQHLIRANAPRCITNDVPYENLDISIGKILNNCPPGAQFLKSSIQREFVMFALTHPKATARLAGFGLGAAFTDSASNYGNAVSILPRSFSGYFFGETYPNIANSNVQSQVEGMDILKSGKALWLFTPIAFWLFMGACSAIFSQNKRRDNLYLALIMAASIFQAAFMVILLPSEWVRQTSPFIIGALITSIILSLKLFEAISETKSNSDK